LLFTSTPPNKTKVDGHWHSTDLAAYQWHRFGPEGEEETVAPVAECARHEEARSLQSLLLPPNTEPTSLELMDLSPRAAKVLEDRYALIKDSRDDAMRHCILNPQRLTLSTDMPYLTNESSKSLVQLIEENAKEIARLAPLAPVESFFLAKTGERYLRVLALAPSIKHGKKAGGGGGGGPITPQLLVMTERELRDAATAWYEGFLAKAATKLTHVRTICPAFFGILGSRMHLYFDPLTGKWRLWLNVRYVDSNRDSPNFLSANNTYLSYLTVFPYAVTRRLPEGTEMTVFPPTATVSYYDLQRALDDEGDKGLARLDNLLPYWLFDTIPSGEKRREEGERAHPSLMAHVPLSAGAESYTKTLDAEAVNYFVYCQQVERVLLARAGVKWEVQGE
jgi:hypothetical protein